MKTRMIVNDLILKWSIRYKKKIRTVIWNHEVNFSPLWFSTARNRVEAQKYGSHGRETAKGQPMLFYCSFALFEVEFIHKKWEPLKLMFSHTRATLIFSPQLISFILGIYYLLNIHSGADIDLYIFIAIAFLIHFFILLFQTHPQECIS